MVAEPGKIGLLSLAVQVYGAPSIVAHIPASKFHPKPKVDSVVVAIDVHPEPLVSDPDRFFRVAKAGFRAPRKQLHNSLVKGLDAEGDLVKEALGAGGHRRTKKALDALYRRVGQVVGGAGVTGVSKVTIETPAKVNLTLEVLGKREDGYHEIASVMQAISLFDTLTFVLSDEIKVLAEIEDLGTQDNLVYRAALLLRETSGVSAGAEVHLDKQIPLAAGLGGGSSDAAATLLGLDRLWGLELGEGELKDLAARLGSDVPFFVTGGTALVEGRGERVSNVKRPPTLWLVLAFPDHRLENKTATAYKALSHTDYTDGLKTASLVKRIEAGSEIGHDSFFNVFDSVAAQVFPGIDGSWSILQEASDRPVHLSGAGPTLFCRVDGHDEGQRVVTECAARGLDSRLVRALGPGEGPRVLTDE